MASQDNNIAAPQIRFFQFGPDALGAFSKSVNLFRGDVNYPLQLFSMPGRSGAAGTSLAVSIMYQSNLQNDMTTQNLTAPTSILGQGWSMPANKVVFASNGAVSKGGRAYQLESNDIAGNLILTETIDGKEYYQLDGYEFWIICYDPSEESWTITKEDGTRQIYGGGLDQTDQGNKTSQGNSIAWGVRYGNWVGSTSLTRDEDPDADPAQYAREWYLSSTQNGWGDVVSYEYNGFPSCPDGLIQGVEQYVGGTQGKPYTKAVYLTRITDVFGRTAVFGYGDKLYDTSSDGAPKEYQAAHSYQANTTEPNGFQDIYETMYLDQIAVNDSAGTSIQTLVFDYAPLANLSDFQSDTYLYGVTYKRFLNAIRSIAEDGTFLPDINFSYYMDTSVAGAQLGALQSITTPEGAVGTYAYVRQELDICERNVNIPMPGKSIMGAGSLIPRVWFGTDFAVVTWYNVVNGKLWLGIYSWLGYWQLWNPNDPIIFDEDGITLELPNVMISDRSFGLEFTDSRNTYLFIYQKDVHQSGSWISYNDSGASFLTFPSTNVTFTSGTNFIVASVPDPVKDATTLSRVTWNWKTRVWMVEKDVSTVTAKTLFLTGGAEYYLTAVYDPQSATDVLNLYYLGMDVDGKVAWQAGGQQTLSNILPVNNDSQIPAPGVSMVALVVETDNTQNAVHYDLYALGWDENYQFQTPFSASFTMNKNREGVAPVSIAPYVISNSTVVSGETLLRYNGSTWLINTELQIESPSSPNEYWFAHGDDFNLKTVNMGPYGVDVAMLVYDPSDPSEITEWKTPPIPLPTSPAPSGTDPRDAWFPTASGEDFFTSGNTVYYRGSSTNWIAPSNDPVFTIAGDINTTSVINQGPSFLAYLIPDPVTPINTKTIVLELKNGQVIGEGYELDNQCYSTGTTSGTAPSGPGMFLTFPSDTIDGKMDNAASLTLYRYAGDAIDGPLIHYPVSRLTVTNGFGENSFNTYVFEAASAACDPSGKVVKYYTSTTYPGSDKADGSDFGSTVSYYINGYNGDKSKNITYYLNGQKVTGRMADPTLDGYQLSTEDRDNQSNMVKRQVYTWDVFTLRNRSSTVKDTVNLYGSYTRQRALEQTLDGVVSSSGSNYIPNGFEVPFSGLAIDKDGASYNGLGALETTTTSTVYGYEKYPDLVGLNYLTAVAQTTQFVKRDGEPTIPGGAKVSTWKDWGSGQWGAYQSYQWEGGVSDSFPFPSDYGNPEGWLPVSMVTAMNPHGLTLETVDVMAVPSSVIYDSNSEYVIAQFQNASVAQDEADYYGFEAIEAGTGWTMNDAATIITGDSYTGRGSLCLEQSGTLSKTYTPGRMQVYVLGYWYKTSPGYAMGSGSGWTVTVSSGSGTADAFSKPFEDTRGTWVFDYMTIDLSASGGGTASMAVRAENQSNDSVTIDNVRMVPNLSGFTAYVYDTSRNLTLVQMGQGTHLERVFYDQFGRRAGTTGPFEDQLNNVYLNYYSRSGNPVGFNPLDPNSQVLAQALDGGFNETFLDPNGWKANWNASNADTSWTSGNGQLCHTTSSISDTLSLNDPTCQGDFFLTFGIKAIDPGQPLVLTDVISVTVGAGNCFSWDPGNKAWSFKVGGKNVTPICGSEVTPLNWGLSFKNKTVLFYANGRILLSVVSDTELSGELSLVTGKNEFAYYYLALSKRPKTGVVFNDAMSHPRQNQALSGTNGIVTQTVTNPLGKAVITTGKAPAFFGDIGKNTPLMTYRPSFVDMPAFLVNLNGSGEMTGDVSTYYNGQNGASDDEGYPYSRSLLERSPLARTIEQGVAGKSYAIIDPWTFDQTSTKTVKITYSNNATTPVSGVDELPAGEYYVTTRTSQDGIPSHGISTKTNTSVVKAMPAGVTCGGESPATNLLNQSFVVYETGGRTETQRLPNYFDPAVSGNDKFVIVKTYDLLNNMLTVSTPDNGTVQALYNPAGKVRFQQDARGAVDGYYAYVKYDVLGRTIENGILSGSWDPAMLQGKIDDPNWPAGLSGQFIQKQQTYVSYLDTVNGLGSLAAITTRSEDGVTVLETYAYDRFSRVATAASKVADASGTLHEGSVDYGYTPVGSLSRVVYPPAGGVDIGTVYYSFDDLNRMVGVGKSADEPDSYASYSYAADGTLADRSLNAGGIDAAFTYHPPGWTASMLGPDPAKGFNETLPEYYPDGLIRQVSDVLAGADFDVSLDLSATYDPSGSLVSVDYKQRRNWNMTVLSYDPNANFLALSSGEQNETYHYKPGTDQVTAINADNLPNLTFSYDAGGGVSRVSSLSSGTAQDFTYVKNGFLTARIALESSGDVLDLYYGASGRRALKQLSNGDRVKSRKFYLHGVHNLPLMETEATTEDGATEAATTAYIYGDKGMIAFQTGGDLSFVVKDHLGSSRMVYDASNTVQAAWSYATFGEKQIVHKAGSSLLSYLYAGREWDKETGLYNFQARLYDPRLRRFYVTDPKSQFAGAYVFAGNDPLSLVDPSGMWSWTDTGEAVLSGAEIVGGGIMLATGVAAGGVLLTTGLSSMGEIIESNVVAGKSLSWGSFFKDQIIGLVSGGVSAGIGAGVSAAANKWIGEGLLRTAVKVVSRVGLNTATNTAMGAAGNVLAGNKASTDLYKEIGISLVTAGIGEGIGGIKKNVKGVEPSRLRNIVTDISAGAIGGSVGGIITGIVERKNFNWLDLGINVATGVSESVLATIGEPTEVEYPRLERIDPMLFQYPNMVEMRPFQK